MDSQHETELSEKSVSIFYPCYQDWGTMGSMILLTVETAERLELDYDVTIVDDGSREHTHQLLDRIERDYPKVRAIYHPRNRGYGGALRSGL